MKADTLRPELKTKVEKWLVSFHRLDPRYKILKFFNQVASEGADNLVDEQDEVEYASDSYAIRPPARAESLLKKVFNLTSILTVWRPTSNDAMRKMMEGTGVGKGLDIKGKSAKKGILSAFVPFMQIHEEKDKQFVQEISYDAKLRLYYSSNEGREKVMKALQPIIDKQAPTTCNDSGKDDDGGEGKDAMDCRIRCIDEYTKRNWYGLEVSQRLFWEAYVTIQDITRDEVTATGRPSTPGFQDANLKTLKVACKTNPKPMPVIVQYDKDAENSMKPQTLVMAYEENGTVTPVVSDFDGFLLGWRREALWFGCNLPREQEELMIWCVNQIGDILDSRPTCDTWTVRWLEILKRESKNGFHPDIPEYGFGDPKSYAIMEQTAKRLIDTGAVRHGMECFNYYFPQEIDEYFLVVSDMLPGKVPWKYVGVEELQEILSMRIQEGFVFPLNPKWILCDQGWKRIYDELMASEALYADLSKDVWYPPFSGVREKIEDIHKRHPHGFKQAAGSVRFEPRKGYSPLRQNLERGDFMSANAAFALAELELEIYNSKKGSAGKLLDDMSLEGITEEDLLDTDDELGIDISDRSRGKKALPGGGTSNHSKDKNSSIPKAPKPKAARSPVSPKPKGMGLRGMFRMNRDEHSFGEEEAKRENPGIKREKQRVLPRERSPAEGRRRRSPRAQESRGKSPRRERSPRRPNVANNADGTNKSPVDRRRMLSSTHGAKNEPRRNFSEWEAMQKD